MTISDLMYFFRTDNLSKISRLIGVSRTTMYKWHARGEIPYLRQLYIQQLTNGALLAEDNNGHINI